MFLPSLPRLGENKFRELGDKASGFVLLVTWKVW